MLPSDILEKKMERVKNAGANAGSLSLPKMLSGANAVKISAHL
jgi:hypothetical protein